MRFFFGVAIGALGMWAYRSGKLQPVIGQSPVVMQDAMHQANERISRTMNSDPVQGVVARAQGKTSDVVTPTASEISGRPSEPLPVQGSQ